MGEIKTEAKLTFTEATSIIIGHGVGSGILAVPFLASRNSLGSIFVILALVYAINLVMHFMIAELSYNNGGAQLIKCFENELLTGKIKKVLSWAIFALLGFSVLVNVSGFIVGASDVLNSWLGISPRIGMLIYYILAALVVLFGMKIVGICEKYSVLMMIIVMIVLFGAVMTGDKHPMPAHFVAKSNWMVLYSIVAFSLSAVMSVPQVVKGLEGNTKKIKASIACGTGINLGLILLITITTMIGAGTHITTRGALVDLSEELGGWVSIIGYIFSLLALSTSFWANTLNLRDVVDEQTQLGTRKSWVIASLPCVFVALLGLGSFVGLVRLASVIQVLTGLGVILSYNRSRKKQGNSVICGIFGALPFQIIVVLGSIMATLGALVKVK